VDGENADSRDLVRRLMSHGTGVVRDITPIMPDDFQHAMYFSGPHDPEYTLSCRSSTRDCHGPNSAVGLRLRIPCGARVPTGTDRQLFVIDQRTRFEWDLAGTRSGQRLCGGGVLQVTLATRIRIDGDGRGSCATDAACVGSSAGQLRARELEAGSIQHALFVVDGDCDAGGAPASVFPAQPDNSCRGSVPGAPKVGQWFRLDLTDAQIAATGYPAWQQTLLRALSHYGMFVGDQGSNGAFDIYTESHASYASFGSPNPWTAYARRLARRRANRVAIAPDGTIRFRLDDIPHAFWLEHLRAVSPCAIARTC
jgi:hypothetical protein